MNNYKDNLKCKFDVASLTEEILRNHYKRVDSLLEQRLDVILTTGLTRRERRLDTSKLTRNEYPDKTEWFYNGKLILTSTLPKFELSGDNLWVTEGVLV